MHIGFVIDHPKRDLPGAGMLAWAAAKRGHRLSIIPMYEQAVDIPLLDLNALIVNYARPANRDLLRGYHALGLPVFVLDTEGGILAETGANSLQGLPQAVREGGYKQWLAGYLFWGRLLHDAFAAHSGMEANRLHVTGCPRFDFASSRWAGTLSFDRSGYILVNANFPLVNSRFSRSPDEEAATMVRGGWPRDYVDTILAEQRRIQAGLLAAIKKCAQRNPKLAFLVRPHPFERGEVYTAAFADCPNVVVDGRGSVLNAIQASRAVLHVNCGTSVEALMLNRLPVSLEFLNSSTMRRHSALPSVVSRKAMDEDDLSSILQNLDSESAQFPFAALHREFVQPWFHYNDGRAAERVLDVVVPRAVEVRRPSISHSLGAINSSNRLGQRLQALGANLAGSLLVSKLRSRLSPQRLDKHLMVAQVRDAVGALARHERADPPRISYARHPWSGLPLGTVTVGNDASADGAG